MQAILWPIVSWIFREAVLKFCIMGVAFIAVSQLAPLVINQISPFIGTSSLTSAFSNIPPGVWYFLDFMGVGFGMPLVISAYVSRFLIRRIPFIG